MVLLMVTGAVVEARGQAAHGIEGGRAMTGVVVDGQKRSRAAGLLFDRGI
jgi:hypothetical protein